jgi:putative membrane protein
MRSLLETPLVRTAFGSSEDIMKRPPILVAIFLCAASGTSIAQNTDDTRSSISASEFVEKAGRGGLAEVEMGELGAQKATNGQVKAFAKRIVTDHTQANEELVAVIKGKGLQVPSSQSATHKAMMDRFQQQDAGKDFDRDYIEHMVEDHKIDIELFETAADDANLDADLRGYAKKTLPTLRDHLKQAQTIESKLSH